MSGDGFEFSDWEEFQRHFANINWLDEEFMKAAHRIARSFLRRIQPRTPKGKTKELYRHWRTHVEKQGNDYVVYIYNPMYYASFVEDGHRTRKGKGKKSSRINSKFWVEGRKMMALTMDDIERWMPRVVKNIENRLAEMLDGN